MKKILCEILSVMAAISLEVQSSLNHVYAQDNSNITISLSAAPVTGMSISESAITVIAPESGEYTGTVVWTPITNTHDTTFIYGNTYRAEITLNAGNSYSFLHDFVQTVKAGTVNGIGVTQENTDNTKMIVQANFMPEATDKNACTLSRTPETSSSDTIYYITCQDENVFNNIQIDGNDGSRLALQSQSGAYYSLILPGGIGLNPVTNTGNVWRIKQSDLSSLPDKSGTYQAALVISGNLAYQLTPDDTPMLIENNNQDLPTTSSAAVDESGNLTISCDSTEAACTAWIQQLYADRENSLTTAVLADYSSPSPYTISGRANWPLFISPTANSLTISADVLKAYKVAKTASGAGYSLSIQDAPGNYGSLQIPGKVDFPFVIKSVDITPVITTDTGDMVVKCSSTDDKSACAAYLTALNDVTMFNSNMSIGNTASWSHFSFQKSDSDQDGMIDTALLSELSVKGLGVVNTPEYYYPLLKADNYEDYNFRTHDTKVYFTKALKAIPDTKVYITAKGISITVKNPQDIDYLRNTSNAGLNDSVNHSYQFILDAPLVPLKEIGLKLVEAAGSDPAYLLIRIESIIESNVDTSASYGVYLYSNGYATGILGNSRYNLAAMSEAVTKIKQAVNAGNGATTEILKEADNSVSNKQFANSSVKTETNDTSAAVVDIAGAYAAAAMANDGAALGEVGTANQDVSINVDVKDVAAATEQKDLASAAGISSGDVIKSADVAINVATQKKDENGNAVGNKTTETVADTGSVPTAIVFDTSDVKVPQGEVLKVARAHDILNNDGTVKDTEITLLDTKSSTDGTTATFNTTEYSRFYLVLVNSTLKNLSISSGTLSPAFDAGTTSYSAEVNTDSLSITPTAADTSSKITVNGTEVTSGTAAQVSLAEGTNTIPVVVTGTDGTSTTYTLTIRYTKATSAKEVVRLSGNTRYLTMSEIVNKAYPSGTTSDVAIVATGDNFPDALSASTLAGVYEAPLITTSSQSLSQEAKDELISLKVKTVYIVGGTNAVSEAAETEIKNMGIEVKKRLSGSSRYETNLKVNDQVKESGQMGKTAIIATGNNFPDALSVGPLAYGDRDPIYLVNQDISEETKEAISASGCTSAVIVGGTGVVGAETERWLKEKLGDAKVQRFSGNGRYDTNAKFAEYLAAQGYSYDGMGLATGENFPDALAAATLCGRKKSILVLMNGKEEGAVLPTIITSNASSINNCYLMGGTSAVNAGIENGIKAAINK